MPNINPMAVIEDIVLPDAVRNILATAKIQFDVQPAAAINPAQRLYSTLLQHHSKQLLVLLPHTHILNLNTLNSATQAAWQPLPFASTQHLLSQYALQTLPPLPALFAQSCLCDPAVFTHNTVYFESGIAGQLIALKTTDLTQLLGISKKISCAEPISQVQPNHCAMSSDLEQIKSAVTRLTTRRIHQRLEQTLEVPVLNKTSKQVLRLYNNPESNVDELTAIVETDPALAAQVISWAASPYYAAPSKVRSVEDAIVRVLGFDLVLSLALGLSLKKSLNIPRQQPRNATPYWQKAIYTAALIEGLTRAMPADKKPESGLAYLAGLLHNFGFALLAHVFPPHYTLVCQALDANLHLKHSVVEHHLLGVTREQMGAWLMQYWNIPQELVYAVRFQDKPDYQGQHASYANLNCLAQSLLAQHGIGCPPHDTHIPESLYLCLGLTAEQAQKAVQQVLQAELALQRLTQQFSQP